MALEDAVNAWDFAKKNKYCIDKNYIKGVHKELMTRLNPRIAGKIRTISVYIVGRGEHKECLKPELIENELESWVKTYSNPKKELEIKEAHTQFEKIHPFEDGNGRTGRILMNIQRLNASFPLLIIHKGEEQFEYYKWFK